MIEATKMSNSDSITNKLKEMSLFIDQAEAALKKGEVINLSHLDKEVEKLCEQALNLPPEDAKAIQPIMGEVISKLENLALSLQNFQSSLKDRAEDLKKHEENKEKDA